jgi:hypothetical protein
MCGYLAVAAVPAIEFMEPFTTQERTMGMTTTTKKLLEQVADWPEEDQEELAELAREIEARRTGVYRLSDAEKEGIEQGLQAIREGRFASEERIAAVLDKARSPRK